MTYSLFIHFPVYEIPNYPSDFPETLVMPNASYIGVAVGTLKIKNLIVF